MSKQSKRFRAASERLEVGRVYPIEEALHLVKEMASVGFHESVDVSVNLGVDPRKSDQVVRGSTVLPNGTGKTVRVAVFAQGDNADKAKEAGADIIGFEDLAEQIKGGAPLATAERSESVMPLRSFSEVISKRDEFLKVFRRMTCGSRIRFAIELPGGICIQRRKLLKRRSVGVGAQEVRQFHEVAIRVVNESITRVGHLFVILLSTAYREWDRDRVGLLKSPAPDRQTHTPLAAFPGDR